MKNFYRSFPVLVVLILVMQSCVKDKLQSTYTYYTQVYKSKTEVWQNIKSNSPQPLQRPGKFFLLGKFIFINELNKGVHVIDNTDPHAPKNISFISIPGNLDIAVKNKTLYADLYTDMLTIDITDPTNITLKKVSNKVFPEREYFSGANADSTQYVVDWIKQETTNKRNLEDKVLEAPVFWYTAGQLNTSSAGVANGISGSMARFTIVNNYLYTVGRTSLTAFNIASETNPVVESLTGMGWNIETIYPLKDKLFIGSQTGMFIYSIADPANPQFLSSFQHACFNDPVIADDHYAYVTLRARTDESNCWGVQALQRNELDIVDISNITGPSLVKIYDMAEPKGLSKDGNHLFICDGKEGLKIFDATNVQALKQVNVVSDINPFDVICIDGVAMVVAGEGIYQYDYSDISNIKLISKIPVDQQ